MEQRYAIKFCLKKQMKPKDIIMELQKTYGDACLSETQIYFWIREIKCGREDLSNLPKQGRPVDEQLTVAIQKVHDENKFASSRNIAQKVHVSHTTVLDHMTNLIGLKFVHLRVHPHLLTKEQMKNRVKLAKVLLRNLSYEESTGYEFVLTGDESWFVFHYPTKEIWIMKGEDIPAYHKNTQYEKKSMFTIFINGKGVQIIDLKPIDTKISADYFINNILLAIEDSEIMKKSKKWKHKLCLHYDNAPSHTAEKVKIHNEISKVKIWDHPAYSPDLAICDFGLFGTMKETFKGNDFENEEELLEAINHFFASKSEDFFKSLFSEWIRRLKLCISHNGNYI